MSWLTPHFTTNGWFIPQRFFQISGLRLHPNGGIVPQRELADSADDAQSVQAEVVAGQA